MIVLIIIIVALIALVLYLYLYRRRERISGYTPYTKALVALLENNEDLAMKRFKEAVNIDSDLVDAYIRLGDIYRKKGDFSTAIKIHQSLTVRPTMKKQVEKKVYYALADDMLATNRHNKATSFLKEILKIDRKDNHARQMILKIYEDIGSYGDCITVYEESGFKPKTNKRRAFYYASFAADKLKSSTEKDADAEKEAFGLLKKALRISASSLTALYQLADYYEQKDDLKKAKEYCYKIITQHPDQAFLIVSKFEKIYFELGLFDAIMPIYEKIFHKNPKNFAVGFALADLYEKKNDVETAREIYGKLADVYPESILPKLHLIESRVEDESLQEKIAEIRNIVSHKNYKCKNCGFEAEKFAFLCPKCHAIESFVPYL